MIPRACSVVFLIGPTCFLTVLNIIRWHVHKPNKLRTLGSVLVDFFGVFLVDLSCRRNFKAVLISFLVIWLFFVFFCNFRRFCLDSRFVFVLLFNFSHVIVFSLTFSHFCKF